MIAFGQDDWFAIWDSGKDQPFIILADEDSGQSPDTRLNPRGRYDRRTTINLKQRPSKNVLESVCLVVMRNDCPRQYRHQ